MTGASRYTASPPWLLPAPKHNGFAKGASLAALILTGLYAQAIVLGGASMAVLMLAFGADAPGTNANHVVLAAIAALAVAAVLGGIPVGLTVWLMRAADRSNRARMLVPLSLLSALAACGVVVSVIAVGPLAAYYADFTGSYTDSNPYQKFPQILILGSVPWFIVLVLCWIGWAKMGNDRTPTPPPGRYVMPPSVSYYGPPPPVVGQPGFGAEPYGQPGYSWQPFTQPGFGQPPQGTPDQPNTQSGFGAPPPPEEPPH